MPITFNNSSTNTGTVVTAVINVPTGTVGGDIIVAAVAVANNSTIPTITTPAGWTSIDFAAQASGVPLCAMRVMWHAWAAGETSYNVTTNTSSGSWVAQAASYTGVDSTIPIDQHNIGVPTTASATTAVATPTVTSSTSNVWRVSMFSGGSSTTANAWGSYSPADTERQDFCDTVGTRHATMSFVDSNAGIDASGGTSVTATPSVSSIGRTGAIVLLNPLIKPAAVIISQQALDRASRW